MDLLMFISGLLSYKYLTILIIIGNVWCSDRQIIGFESNHSNRVEGNQPINTTSNPNESSNISGNSYTPFQETNSLCLNASCSELGDPILMRFVLKCR